MAYLSDSAIISRSENEAIELPPQVASNVVKGIEGQSVVAQLARRVPMSSKNFEQPLINGLPTAGWLNSDTGLKTTTTVKFDDVTLVAEPLACLVVVPDDFFDDSAVPIWPEVQPLIAEEFGKKIDQAVLWGTNKPSSWTSPALYVGAAAAGNYAELAGSNTDYFQTIAQAGKLVAEDGFAVNGIAHDAGLWWDVAASRTADGVPLANMTDLPPGVRVAESRNGGWTDTETRAIVGDWSKVLFGVRQDIRFTIHTDAVISDTNGVVTFNAMQQDSKIMRVVGRFAYAVANPVTNLNSTGTRFPMALVTDAGSVGS